MAATPNEPFAPRIFVDTSVILAGAASGTGASNAVLSLGSLGLLQLVVCDYILEETLRNLQRKLARALPRYEEISAQIAWEIVADPNPADVRRWEAVIRRKDAPVLAAAVSAKPARLVTLDVRDFLRVPDVQTHAKLSIITPAELLREIRAVLVQSIIP